MTFDYTALEAAGFTKVTIDYSGHNDEGWINDIIGELDSDVPAVVLQDDLYRAVEQAAYDVLYDNFGGWEINEGSSGQIILDVKARKANIAHDWVVESTQRENVELR
jgi:hypothetical protein